MPIYAIYFTSTIFPGRPRPISSSVLASRPFALAKSRTCLGFTTTTDRFSEASRWQSGTSNPLVASTTISYGDSPRSLSARHCTSSSLLLRLHHFPVGCTAQFTVTSGKLIGSICKPLLESIFDSRWQPPFHISLKGLNCPLASFPTCSKLRGKQDCPS